MMQNDWATKYDWENQFEESMQYFRTQDELMERNRRERIWLNELRGRKQRIMRVKGFADDIYGQWIGDLF